MTALQLARGRERLLLPAAVGAVDGAPANHVSLRFQGLNWRSFRRQIFQDDGCRLAQSTGDRIWNVHASHYSHSPRQLAGFAQRAAPTPFFSRRRRSSSRHQKCKALKLGVTLHDHESPAPRFYPADLGGDTVNCDSMQDAEIVSRAGLILDGAEPGPFEPSVLHQLADILNKYRKVRAARILLDRYGAPKSST